MGRDAKESLVDVFEGGFTHIHKLFSVALNSVPHWSSAKIWNMDQIRLIANLFVA